MILPELQLIFIHIPKTGGTSIEHALTNGEAASHYNHRHACGINKGKLKGGTWRQHFTYSDLRHNGFNKCMWPDDELCKNIKEQEYIKKWGEEDDAIHNQYFKFAFVRNPFDKLVSEYYWRKSSYNQGLHGCYGGAPPPEDFKDFICNIEKYSLKSDAHYWPQHEFIYDSEGKLQVDFVGRLENLVEDFNIIRKRIKSAVGPLPHLQKTHHKPYQEHYNPQTKQIVEKLFERDLDLFGYTFDER